MFDFEFVFEWDETKAKSNAAKHGIQFETVRKLFREGDVYYSPSRRPGEVRFSATGNLDGTLVTVLFTIRNDRIRLISARKASNEERREFRRLYGERT